MVSIIIPVYNVEKYLDDCLKSIINQTYKNLEIILIDDGSTDSCAEICDKWKNQDSRIEVIHKQNGGLSSARNSGLDISQGKYIMFVDSDDIIAKDMVETLRNPLESDPEIDLSVCGIETFIDGDISHQRSLMRIAKGKYSNNEYMSLILSKKVDNAAWNKMYRSEMLANLRFIEGIINEDFPFISELLSKCKKIEYLSEPLYFYRLRKNSITRGGINKKCWDYVSNAINFKTYLAKKFDDLDKEIVNSYIYAEMIGQLSTIIKYNGENEFKSEYSESKSYVKSNMQAIIASKNLNIKSKIKAVISIYWPSLLKH